MKYALIFILLLTALNTKAQSGCATSCMYVTYKGSGKNDGIDNLQRQMMKYKRRRTAGIGMMAAGGGLFLVGEAMLWTSVGLNAVGKRNYQDSSQDPLWDAGFGSTLAGIGLLGGGIPLYLVSNRRMRAYKKRIAALKAGQSGIIIQ